MGETRVFRLALLAQDDSSGVDADTGLGAGNERLPGVEEAGGKGFWDNLSGADSRQGLKPSSFYRAFTA